ncbi:PREDICTED: uncharacterized protein LOC101372645 [Odobenus rosmarus divergens]|uniref:Uncharacterized protein LOC101372645 n=1 Tax=Odobenus rosmarus divergens TaxID=9708 RepID=A0A9B0M3E1_ODORO
MFLFIRKRKNQMSRTANPRHPASSAWPCPKRAEVGVPHPRPAVEQSLGACFSLCQLSCRPRRAAPRSSFLPAGQGQPWWCPRPPGATLPRKYENPLLPLGLSCVGFAMSSGIILEIFFVKKKVFYLLLKSYVIFVCKIVTFCFFSGIGFSTVVLLLIQTLRSSALFVEEAASSLHSNKQAVSVSLPSTLVCVSAAMCCPFCHGGQATGAASDWLLLLRAQLVAPLSDEPHRTFLACGSEL